MLDPPGDRASCLLCAAVITVLRYRYPEELHALIASLLCCGAGRIGNSRLNVAWAIPARSREQSRTSK